jgi:DNA polymerase III delta subunit
MGVILLTGPNDFAIREAKQAIVAAFKGVAEQLDGAELKVADISDLLMGSTLFAETRLIIITDLSENKAVWDKLPEWLPRMSDQVQLVLVDQKPDKRTSAYKELKKVAEVREFPAWGERDQALAERWVMERAGTLGLDLDKKIARLLVERIGMDQWGLSAALEKVSLLETITEATVSDITELNPTENVFQLFELALEGNARDITLALRTLELSQDPYQLFALLSSQAFQLAAVASAGSKDDPAKDIGIHPFVTSKLARHAKRLGRARALRIVKAFADADADLKSSRGEPWLIIEKTLLGI